MIRALVTLLLMTIPAHAALDCQGGRAKVGDDGTTVCVPLSDAEQQARLLAEQAWAAETEARQVTEPHAHDHVGVQQQIDAIKAEIEALKSRR